MCNKTQKIMVFFVFALFGLFILPPKALAAPPLPRPNFIIIVSDDQNYGTLGQFMPYTQAKIFDKGVTFTNAFVTTSICCPSRSSILTGMYASRHKVLNNKYPLNKPTLANHLHSAGYYTGLVGKYLNSWNGTPRPEYDYWVSFEGGASKYYDPRLNVNGLWEEKEGYITGLLGDYALNFLKEANAKNTPFFLLFTPNAPHDPAQPETQYKDLYKELELPFSPNFNPASVDGKPAWLKSIPRFSKERTENARNFRLAQLRTLRSLDDAIAKIMENLEADGMLKNTFVVYISDNGVMWGAHRLSEKNYAYEEAVHVPFAIRYTPLIGSPRIENNIVANIDIAPTLYDLAGISIPQEVEGRSLVSLLKNTNSINTSWRSEIFFEGWPRERPKFLGLRTLHYTYIETEIAKKNFVELYNLQVDPYQLKNLAGLVLKENMGIEKEFRSKLAEFRGSHGG